MQGSSPKDTQQLINTKLARGEKAVVVASEEMSDEPSWEELKNKHLAVIDSDLKIKLIPVED